MKLKIAFLLSKASLGRNNSRMLEETISNHARRGGKLLGIDLLNITVHLNKDSVIPETGEVGFAGGDDWIHLTVDPTRKREQLRQIITTIIPSTIYHETSHIARNKSLGRHRTLLDSVVFEGLANTFAEEQWPMFDAPWTQYSEPELTPFLRILKIDGQSEKYSHDEWFFGRGKKPRWIGYKLGSYIIRSAKARNAGLTALKMVKMETKEIATLTKLD